MKKKLVIILLISFFASCEKDDICIDETTPHLIVKFYDKDNPDDAKKVTNLKVEVENYLDEKIQIDNVSSRDSIILPLNVDLDLTKIYLTKNVTDDNPDGIEESFILNYSREDVYVSRSCGYKTIYKSINVSDELTDDWIQTITIVEENVENENQAHLNIFH